MKRSNIPQASGERWLRNPSEKSEWGSKGVLKIRKLAGGRGCQWWRWWCCAPGLLRSEHFPPGALTVTVMLLLQGCRAADPLRLSGRAHRAGRMKADREWGAQMGPGALWLTGAQTHTFCLRHIIYPMRRVTLRLLPLTLHWLTVISCDLWTCGGIKTPLSVSHTAAPLSLLL